MKTIKIYIILFLSGLILTQCKNSEERSKSIVEKAAEAAGMPEVDASNVHNASKNNVSLDVDLTQLNPAFDFKNAFGSITANREVVAINVVDEVENGVRSIIIGIIGKDLRQLKPLKAEIGTNNEVNANFMIQKLDGSSTISFMAKSGIIEVTKFSEREALVQFDLKISNTMDAGDDSKLMDLKGSIKMEYPTIATIGDDKSEFLY